MRRIPSCPCRTSVPRGRTIEARPCRALFVLAAPMSAVPPPVPPRALIREPRSVPVVGNDAHLPALPAVRLQPEWLRGHFAGSLEGRGRAFLPELPGDGPSLAERTPRAAAVLVAMVQRPAGLAVLLTRRTDHLHDHAGQISFPGGRTDDGDADAVATALREAEEEIGLPHSAVEVIGRLPVYTTVTAYDVTPVVALVDPQALRLQADPFEVAEVFEVPLAFLMDPANHHRHAVQVQGLARHFLSMPWEGIGPDGVSREYFIWGATAAMLRNLYRFIGG